MNILRSAALATATALGAAVLTAAPPALASTVHIPTTTRTIHVVVGKGAVSVTVVLPRSVRSRYDGHRVSVWAVGIGSPLHALAHGNVDRDGRLHVTLPDRIDVSGRTLRYEAGSLGISTRDGLAGLRSATWTSTRVSWEPPTAA